jgi:anti-sigma B factor antagonist
MTTESIQILASDGAARGQRILTLRGPLNIHTIFDFQAAIRAEQSPVVILDLTGVPYVDSAGLGAIVGAYVSAQRAHRKLVLAGSNERVKALLSMTQVAQLFASYATAEAAGRAST